MPAIQRYESHRIESVYNAASNLNLKFLILSGKHGMLDSNEPIEYYDHLLRNSEIEEHATKVADQLETLGVTEILFLVAPVSEDESVKPYKDCMGLAARKLGVPVKFIDISIEE